MNPLSTEVSCMSKCPDTMLKGLLRKGTCSGTLLCQCHTTSWPLASRASGEMRVPWPTAPRQAMHSVSRTLIIKLQMLIITGGRGWGRGRDKAWTSKLYLCCFFLMLLVEHYRQDTATQSVSFSHKPVFIISKGKNKSENKSILFQQWMVTALWPIKGRTICSIAGTRTWQEPPGPFICFPLSEEGKLLFFPFLFLCLGKSVTSLKVYILTYVNLWTALFLSISVREAPHWQTRLQKHGIALFIHLTLVTYGAIFIKELLRFVHATVTQCSSQ